jgi:dienelactone hydrolase
MRLDVVLHGRQNTLSEVSFIHEHDDASKPAAAGGRDVIVLSVFGRTNNAYRWAGETDVFEAIASVVDRYNIDPAKIVLRGFSMGGAGAWHMGLHHPDRWAAIEAGAGFTDTKLYAKATDLPPHQEATLRIYDAVDWADNAFNVPLVGYGGELDRQLAAATNIRTALERTGYAFAPEGNGWRGKDIAAIFLVGARTGHEFHRDSKRASDQFIDAALARRNLAPRAIRFVTYTTKYDRAYWVRIDGMEAHYHRAEVDAQLGIGHLPAPTGTGAPKAGPRADMVAATVKTSNVSRLVLTGEAAAAFLTIDGQALPPQTGGGPGEAAVLEKRDGAWIGRPVIPGLSGSEPARRPGRREPTARSLRKRRGLTGPIDDAFTDAFLVVRPTGRSPHAGVSSFTTTALDRFIAEWDKWMRGDVRIKDDRAVTAGDIAAHNLILFGDPSSNAILRRIIAKLPVTWSKGQVGFGKKRFDAGRFVPVLIYPNPLNPDRYVVINSGHTFHEAEFRGTNALLYPRLGDYAVLGTDGAIALAGLFDDDWMLPGPCWCHPRSVWRLRCGRWGWGWGWGWGWPRRRARGRRGIFQRPIWFRSTAPGGFLSRAVTRNAPVSNDSLPPTSTIAGSRASRCLRTGSCTASKIPRTTRSPARPAMVFIGTSSPCRRLARASGRSCASAACGHRPRCS